MKAVIIYESKHHGNTKKVCSRISKECGAALVEASAVTEQFAWKDYDLIGFASGIAYKKFYEQVNRSAKMIPEGKKVFFIYTCANNSADFSEDIRKIVERRGAEWIGTYGCKGFNTYGPLKLIGGMNKSNPNKDELDAAVEFYRKMVNEYE